jgi:hypothetical protein
MKDNFSTPGFFMAIAYAGLHGSFINRFKNCVKKDKVGKRAITE